MQEVRRDEGKIAASRGDQKRLLERREPQAGSSRCICREEGGDFWVEEAV